MSNNLYYDETDPRSIETYGKRLIGKTFGEVWNEDQNPINVVRETSNYITKHEDKNRKGGLGELIEECYFHYAANSDAKADFDKAGVELKVTPYKINKNKTKSAKERLILTMIDYYAVVNETFEKSHLWSKSKLILLIYYLYTKEIKNRSNYRIDYVQLFTPPEDDLAIIKEDFETIVNKIREGKAHELSESDTMYLGAATKSSNSQKRTAQPFNDEMAKPRAFAFKTSYMTYVLNHYIIPGKNTCESILKGNSQKNSFYEYVKEKINYYKEYDIDSLCQIFKFDNGKKPKDLGALIAYRILGIKGNRAEEFEKANIVVKTIRIEKNDKIKESMSFPVFKFKELIQEDWEDSTFGNYLRETKFFFVVYKYDENGILRLKGSQFWNVPYHDLEFEIKSVWEKTKQVITDGLEINMTNRGRTTNLPKKVDNPVCHVRPHGKDASDTDELPDGRQFTKQCFWLNNTYIADQLNSQFFT